MMSPEAVQQLYARLRFLESVVGLAWNEDYLRYERLGFVPLICVDNRVDDTDALEELQPDGTLLRRPITRHGK